jgi:hypothetical protein
MENSGAIYQNDSVLLPFLTSIEEKDVENALSELLLRHVQPVIEKNLRARMRVSLKPDDFSQSNQEALEIAGEAKFLLVAELRKLKTNAQGKSIQSLQSYVASVTVNAYRGCLRKKYPLRHQLKNKLRYLLTHHPEFELRENEFGLICGFNKIAGGGKPLDLEKIKTELESDLDKKNIIESERTIELVRKIFEAAGAPVLLNDLVAFVAEIQSVEGKPEISQAEGFPYYEKNFAEENKTLLRLEDREILGRIWREIADLPRRHRIALLLNLKDRSGDGVIRLFPLLRIASIREIAESLKFPPEEFASVWNELPWDDLKIAEYLGLTRQQVINLRQSARARLARLIEK